MSVVMAALFYAGPVVIAAAVIALTIQHRDYSRARAARCAWCAHPIPPGRRACDDCDPEQETT